jgi:hypothetical protein
LFFWVQSRSSSSAFLSTPASNPHGQFTLNALFNTGKCSGSSKLGGGGRRKRNPAATPLTVRRPNPSSSEFRKFYIFRVLLSAVNRPSPCPVHCPVLHPSLAMDSVTESLKMFVQLLLHKTLDVCNALRPFVLTSCLRRRSGFPTVEQHMSNTAVVTICTNHNTWANWDGRPCVFQLLHMRIFTVCSA